jgi:hypothetical protein
MIGEKILDRAEQRILAGWAKRTWEVRANDQGAWEDRVYASAPGSDVAYCLTGAIGFKNDDWEFKPGPGMRMAVKALCQALPSAKKRTPVTSTRRQLARLENYNDAADTEFDSIVRIIRRAKKILPTLQPGANDTHSAKTAPVATS